VEITLKYFPSICVDNFYDDPDKIREFALSLDYYPSDTGAWPGKRTKLLHEIDENFFKNFCIKVLSLYYDFNLSRVDWEIATSFQLIEPYDPKEDSLKNKGFIHIDKDNIFAGVVYLTPNANSKCGTSLYKVIDQDIIDKDLNLSFGEDIKSKFYKHGIDENFDQEFTSFNSAFEETVRFNNEYNRMISFDSSVYHAANSFYSETPRLTQVFFVKSITSSVSPPLKRFKV
jgi:hypothetical protein